MLGLAAIIVGGIAVSWLASRRRRSQNRAASVRAAAAKFRARHGEKAQAALQKRLSQGRLSPRGRRFYKLVAGELRRASAGDDPLSGRGKAL